MSRVGWIALQKKIFDHWIYKNDKYFKAFCYLLGITHHKKQSVLLKDKIYKVERGDALISIRGLSDKTSLSPQEARTFLKLLVKDTIINTRVNQNLTHLSFINYESYQPKQHTANTENNTPSNTPPTLEKQDKQSSNKGKSREDALAYLDKLDFLNFPLFFDDDLKYKLFIYKKMRKLIKKPLIDEAIQGIINKVDKLSQGVKDDALAIFDYSIENSYQGIFKPKKPLEHEDIASADYTAGRDIFNETNEKD